MANSKFDLSFDFGYNVRPKKPKDKKDKKRKGGRRKLSAAQKATAIYYMKPRRR
jgi:hypothetical protein